MSKTQIAQIEVPSMLQSWKSVLPEFTPRESQTHIMEWIDKLPDDIRYVMCELPVGGGKSPLALATSAYFSGDHGDAFILTPQKILQTQYEESFNSDILASVYGRSNYRCEDKNTDCSVGGDIKPKCENCPATEARTHANASNNMVLNYALALRYFKYLPNDLIPRRALMVFDECHTLESHLVDFGAITVSELRCKTLNVKFKEVKTIEAAVKWVIDVYMPALSREIGILSKKIDSIDTSTSKLSKELENMVRTYKSLRDHFTSLEDVIQLPGDMLVNTYVLVPDKTKFEFKPLYGRTNFRNIILPKADRFLFMSSTILNKKEFCEDLGINPDEAAMISVDSEFNVENRQVIYKPVTKMNYGWDSNGRKSDRDSMIHYMNQIVEHHKDESGIIHTGNFRIAEWIKSELKTEHELIDHGPESGFSSRDEAINYFTENSDKRPMLLISPSITEGLDLKHDKGRFAIIAKIPFPSLGDAWVKRRLQLSQGWYNRQTITGIIQGCGRVVRSPEDWGVVYILDESFTYLYNSTSSIIPNWWKDGLVIARN